MNMGMDGCWYWDTLGTCPGCTPPLRGSQLGLAPAQPHDPQRIRGIDNRWMDGWMDILKLNMSDENMKVLDTLENVGRPHVFQYIPPERKENVMNNLNNF